MSRTGEIQINPHRYWMQQALELADRGRGHVEPNPLVGAVVVKNGNIVGKGWHRQFGQAHAEVHALQAASNSARGATLYVTLEPCCHHGKTPPCVDAILQAGINRVVVALEDPFPEVAGKGLEVLRTKEIEVVVGVCEEEARILNAPFLKLVTTGRPYVHAKWAMTLDGKIATRTGDSMWISGKASRKRVHALRGRVDAILVGSETARIDNPKLTARPGGARVATRVVLDTRGELDLQSHLVQTANETSTLVVMAQHAEDAKAKRLQDAGCEVLALPTSEERIRLDELLEQFGKQRWTNLLVEGGAGVLGAFLDANAIDEFHVFLAPKLIGGRDALTAIAGVGRETIGDCLTFARSEIEECEGDIYIHGWKE